MEHRTQFSLAPREMSTFVLLDHIFLFMRNLRILSGENHLPEVCNHPFVRGECSLRLLMGPGRTSSEEGRDRLMKFNKAHTSGPAIVSSGSHSVLAGKEKQGHNQEGFLDKHSR